MTSYLQHFAGGVVLAALTTELLPQIMHRHAPVAAALGFAAGTALMIVIRNALGGDHGTEDDAGEDIAGSMVVAVAIDMFIDGFLIGLGFAAGARTGVLLTVALALEVLFLGLATSGSRASKTLARTTLYAGLLLAGAATGAGLSTQLNDQMMEVALAFGAAALIYLITEELLVEAHEVKETSWSTGAFSAGFVLIMLADMVG
jgi:ZIP family zinc transporter